MDTPFSSWRAAADIQAAFVARSRVFRELVLRNVVKNADHSVVRWSAKVNEVPVEGVDLLCLGPDGFRLIEVFLRPARDLELVYSEMVAAWPRTE